MPSSVPVCPGETCDVHLCSVGVLSAAICIYVDIGLQLAGMVDVVLSGPRLSMMLRVPQIVHAWITSPSAAPFITRGYAAVWSALCDAYL